MCHQKQTGHTIETNLPTAGRTTCETKTRVRPIRGLPESLLATRSDLDSLYTQLFKGLESGEDSTQEKEAVKEDLKEEVKEEPKFEEPASCF